MRFEPGDEREVKLVPYGGKRAVYGFNNLVDGPTAGKTAAPRKAKAVALPRKRGFRSPSRSGAEASAEHPTTTCEDLRWQRYRATNTSACSAPRPATASAWATPACSSRSSATCAGAPATRSSSAAARACAKAWAWTTGSRARGGAPDLVITNVTIIDAVLGVVKADVGIKDGRICAIGKAGNPQTMDGVTPGLECGLATDAISGAHLILTAAGIDTHIHFISPQQAYAALSNGTTTLIGGGTGPSDGSNATTVTPGPGNIRMMLRAFEGWPVNVGILGKGHGHGKAALVEQIEAGAVGFKCHEDWGTTPAVLRSALTVADEMDVQVCIHTDTLNESGFVEDTIDAFEGRAIHSFHTEGSGGGHAPDIIKIAGLPNVLPSSTNPTLPYGINSQAELYDMIMVCHHFSPDIPSDVAFTESRIRAETIAAENVLQDLGVISMISSDSQAMGRIGECWLRMHPDRRRDEDRARQAAGGRAGQRQFPRAALRGKDHDQPGDHARHLARARLGRGRQDRRPRALGAGVLRRQAQDRAQGRHDQLGRDGRSERVAADAAAGLLSADVRRLRRCAARQLHHLRVRRRACRRHQGALGLGGR